MRIKRTQKVCLPRSVIKLLERDGMGWGHDLDAGCVRFPKAKGKG